MGSVYHQRVREWVPMNNIIRIILIFLGAMLLANTSFAHVRSIYPKSDEIVVIKTSLAFATIIQFPDATTVQFPIIGDQSAFRIEPVDNGITKGLSLKPLRGRAKTNLYLFTDKQRYNFKLVTEGEAEADYIVYIRSNKATDDLKWKTIEKTVSGNELKITLHKVTTTKDQMLLFDLSVMAINEDVKLLPENFWLYQDKKSKLIQSLFLGNTRTSVKKPIQLGIAISKNELLVNQLLEISYRDKKTAVSLMVPSEVLWK